MTADNVSRYVVPQRWVRYDPSAIFHLLIEAKTAGGVLNRMPYLPQWIEQAHAEQLRLEAAGTSRIEGAQFTQREQDEALAPTLTATTRLTHSQRQLRAAGRHLPLAAFKTCRTAGQRRVHPGNPPAHRDRMRR